MATVARAVHYAHQRGILHRDLKPANILLDVQGQPHVTDFGLAKRVDVDRGLTQSGVIVGTPAYMAPEQAAAQKDLTTAVDVYSLGAILYELLTGRPPFQGETMLEVLRAVVEQAPTRPRSLDPRTDRDLETICLKCLEKEPAKRYGSAEALAEDLERWLRGEPILARPVGPVGRAMRWARRRPAVAALCAALVLVLLSGVVTTGWGWLEAEQARQAEEDQRLQAEAAERRALHLAGEEAQQRASAQRRQRQAATLALGHGLSMCEQEQVSRGMLWVAHGLEIAPADAADLQRLLRTELAAWSSQVHPLDAVLQHPPEPDVWAWSPDGNTVLLTEDGQGRLWSLSTGQPLGPPLDLPEPEFVAAAHFNGDGRVLLTYHERTLRRWAAATGKALGRPLILPKPIEEVAVSADGRRFATATQDGTMQVWETATGQADGPAMLHPSKHLHLALSRDGKVLLSAGQDSLNRFWQVATGKEFGPLVGLGTFVRFVAFSPDGQTTVTAGGAKAILLDAAKGRQRGQLLDNQAEIRDLAYSPDSKRLATAGLDGVIRLWDVASGSLVCAGAAHGSRAPLNAVAFSRDGKLLVAGSNDGTARLWEVADGRLSYEPHGAPVPHESPVVAVAFAPGDRIFLTSTLHLPRRQRATWRWQVASGQRCRHALAGGGPDRTPSAVALTPDSKTILLGMTDGTARLLDGTTGKPATPRLRGGAGLQVVGFTPDGRALLTRGPKDRAQLWDAATGQRLGQPVPWQGGPVVLSPNGRRLLTFPDHDTAQLWEITTGLPVGAALKHPATIGPVAFSPDSRAVATAGGKEGRFWDAGTGQPRGRPLAQGDIITALAYSPTGTLLATASRDATVRLWDVATAVPRGKPLRHRDEVLAIAFSPDGKRLLTGGTGEARLWDLARPEPISLKLGEVDWVRAVAFSPDGKCLLTGAVASARQWDAALGQPMGPPWPNRHFYDLAEAVIFSPDGRVAVTLSGDWDRRQWEVRTWAVPTPLDGDVERLQLWVQVLTGMELDPAGTARLLDGPTWRERRRRLAELGGPPPLQRAAGLVPAVRPAGTSPAARQ
jgi:WD40 repeat protein